MYIHAALISNKVSVIRSRWGTVKRHGKVADTNYESGGQEFEISSGAPPNQRLSRMPQTRKSN